MAFIIKVKQSLKVFPLPVGPGAGGGRLADVNHATNIYNCSSHRGGVSRQHYHSSSAVLTGMSHTVPDVYLEPPFRSSSVKYQNVVPRGSRLGPFICLAINGLYRNAAISCTSPVLLLSPELVPTLEGALKRSSRRLVYKQN